MMKKISIICLAVATLTPNIAFSHTINGHYAQLLSCNYGYSSVRGESGYTGTYKVMNEVFTQYFGSNYCPA